MRTVELTAKVENTINELVTHSVKMERQNANLKKVVRILAGSVQSTDDGSTRMVLTQEEADFVQNACDEMSIFG